jgi:hypothetical protein
MKKILSFVLSLSIINCPLSIVYAQEPEEPISEAAAMLQESVQASQFDAPIEDAYNDNLTPQQKFEQDPKFNVHEYDYKQQVVVGGVVMLCIAIAMIANNNYNPKKPKP